MSVLTAASRVTGFVRTWAMAVALGVTLSGGTTIPIASSFNISNNIPNMIYELVAGGVLSSMLIPIFLEKLQRDGKEDAFRFANSLFSLVIVALGAVALVGTFWPEPFVRTQTFTVSPQEAVLATYLFRFFAVQIVFYGLCAVTTGILNSYRHFFSPAIAPLFNNIVVIVALLAFYLPLRSTRPDLALIALAVGTTLGVVALLVVQVPALWSLGFRFRWSWDLSDPTLRKLLRKTVPVIVYVIVNLVGVSFRNAFATQAFRDGSAALTYAWMWYQLPYGVLAVAYITALFPELSDMAERKDSAAYKATFSRGLRVMSVLIMPMAAMLIALAPPLISLYRAGQFPGQAVPLIAPLLQLWACGLFSFCAYMFTLRAFNATQDSTTPMVTALATVGLHVGLYWYLSKPEVLGLAGIPLADTIYYTVHWLVLLVILRRRVGPFSGRAVVWSLARVGTASALGGATAYAVMRLLAGAGAGATTSVAQVLLGGATGLAVTYGSAAVMRVDEIKDGAAMLRRVTGRLVPKGRTS